MIILSMEQVSGVASEPETSFTAAVTSAIVALLVLALERIGSTAANRRDVRRQALEEWLATLGVWVDDHRYNEDETSSRTGSEKYQQLTNRHVLELRFKRKDRYVAWWMHEMALAILKPPTDSSTNESHRRDTVLLKGGEYLLEWHHRKLRSRDFHIPYAIMNEARKSHKEPSDVATELRLPGYESPVRLTIRSEQKVAILLLRPETGRTLLEALQGFIRRRNLIQGYVFSLARLHVGGTLTTIRLAFIRRRLDTLERRQAKRDGGIPPSAADSEPPE